LAFRFPIPPPLPLPENRVHLSLCLLPGLIVLGEDPGPSGSDPAPAPGHGRAEEKHLDRELVEFPVVPLRVDAFKALVNRGVGFGFHGYCPLSIVDRPWSGTRSVFTPETPRPQRVHCSLARSGDGDPAKQCSS